MKKYPKSLRDILAKYKTTPELVEKMSDDDKILLRMRISIEEGYYPGIRKNFR
jgi:hypothetical protein